MHLYDRYNRLKFDPIVTDIYSDDFDFSTTDMDDLGKDTIVRNNNYDLHTARGRRKRGAFTHSIDHDDVIDIESSEDEAINWEEELLKSDEY